MIHFNANFGNHCGYFFVKQKQNNTSFEEQISCEKCNREIVTTWKYDEEGNIVYYKYDKQTGEVLEKIKYKNQYKNIIQPK